MNRTDHVAESPPPYGKRKTASDVLPGYKRTEVGVIPEDWKISKLKRISDFITKGSTPTTYGFKWKDEGILFLRSECVSENGLDLTQSMFISDDAHASLNRSEVHDGDILLTITGNVGRVVHLIGIGSANINQHIARIRITSPSVDAKFIFYYLSQNLVRQYFSSITTGQAYPQISLEQVRNTKIPLPTLDEQRAIAEALSDVDTLIESLQKLIDKKRALKTAAMQQLLTGKIRLLGFSGEWEMKRLGDLLTYERPDKYIVHSTKYTTKGSVPVLTANKSFILGYTNERIGIYDKLPVIIFDDFTTESKYVDFKFKVKSSAIKLLHPKSDDVSLKYIFELMQVLKFPIGDHRRYYISDYQNQTIKTPSFEEQIAIAQILSDMDAEIVALEKRLQKTRAIKEGMMQELLTGRIRFERKNL